MNVEQVKEIATKDLMDVLSPNGMDGIFKVVPGGLLNEETDESYSIEYEIIFTYGNLKHTHNFIIGWNEVDGVGLEHGEDGELNSITYGSVMATMYFDMAMTGLADEYVP